MLFTESRNINVPVYLREVNDIYDLGTSTSDTLWLLHWLNGIDEY